jgi:hypothetical protein
MPWAGRALGHGLLGSDSIARGSVEFEASNPNDLRRVIGDELCPVLHPLGFERRRLLHFDIAF